MILLRIYNFSKKPKRNKAVAINNSCSGAKDTLDSVCGTRDTHYFYKNVLPGYGPKIFFFYY